ncbi:MAG: HPF/RaiA family ribosome-associated protein, partial [Candidatus Binatia bacterium]
MTVPLQITFRNMDSTETIEDEIRDKASKLDHFYDRITSCRVVVEVPHRHHHKGIAYHVRVDVKVPGWEVVINREPTKHSTHEDIYISIQEAFDAARRQLQDYARRQRGEVKGHEGVP